MIRKAVFEDIEQLKEICNEAILHTTATFDMEVKDFENRKAWFEEHQVEPYALFVEDIDGVIAGYASLSRYRERQAFDASVEISVYIHKDYRGKGIGTRLMKEVLSVAKENPKVHTVVSLITSENETSIKLHEKLGFSYCGKIEDAGRKFDRWLGLSTYQILF